MIGSSSDLEAVSKEMTASIFMVARKSSEIRAILVP